MEILFLGLVCTVGVASYRLWCRARTPVGGATALEAADRTPASLQVGDVVMHLGTDYVVEGALAIGERGARLYRLADGSLERYLFVSDGDDPLLLARADAAFEGTPDTVSFRGRTFELRARAGGKAMRAGRLGDRPTGDLLRWVSYAAGASRLLVVVHPDANDLYAGERVPLHHLELLPGGEL
jgi:hypothetical protein